MMFLWQH